MYYSITHPTFQQERFTETRRILYLKVWSRLRKITFLWILINTYALFKKKNKFSQNFKMLEYMLLFWKKVK